MKILKCLLMIVTAPVILVLTLFVWLCTCLLSTSDCQPSLGMLTVNALAAANRIIIPVQAEYLPAKGLEQLLSTVNKVKRQINPKLQIDGILLTMVDSRTNSVSYTHLDVYKRQGPAGTARRQRRAAANRAHSPVSFS